MPPSSEQRTSNNAFDAIAQPSRGQQEAPRLLWLPLGLIAVLLVLTAVLFAVIIAEDHQMQRDALHRDIDSAAQQFSTRLTAVGEIISARSLSADGAGASASASAQPGAQQGLEALARMAPELVAAKPELTDIAYVDGKNTVRWAFSPNALPEFAAGAALSAELRNVVARVHASKAPAYALLQATGANDDPTIVYATPAYAQHGAPTTTPTAQTQIGVVLARLSLRMLMREAIAPEVASRYRLNILLAERSVYSSSESAVNRQSLSYSTALWPLPAEARLQASPFRTEPRFAGAELIWVVGALSAAVIIALAALTRLVTRQARVDNQLLAETTMRRAMEDSQATGLRVLDPQGVIRYVNKSFCQMTGWSEAELVGRTPPFPYWPPHRQAEHREKLDLILSGKAPAAGFEVLVLRRDQSTFDARMYVSPLLDDHGQHIGWITAMADVTEPKRIRNELAAAHERFTKVLESLEAAVSVVGTDEQERPLLFANRAYREMFGPDAAGHQRLAALLQRSSGGRLLEQGEVHDVDATDAAEATEQWFDVRTRNIRWPSKDVDDGDRAAQLQIASNITLRKTTEDIARQQEEKVQFTSRLMTMGEMASSLAHELNQPLTAIANYSEGTLARVKTGRLPQEELLAALEKTSGQAQRAGQIVRRIREFVKRSEPRRRATPVQTVLDDAIGFAQLEANKKQVSIATHVEPDLPPLLIDPILIEQVLLNLLKNAIDAMEHAVVRRIDVAVRRKPLDDATQEPMAEIAVIDRGAGIPEAHLPRLFQPFFSTKSEGMGMGLNICRSIIEFHSGNLHIEPNPEPVGGTIFRFTLPMARENADGANHESPLSTRTSSITKLEAQ